MLFIVGYWTLFFYLRSNMVLLLVHFNSKNEKKNLRKMPLGRSTINTMSSYDKKKIAHKRDMIANSKKRKANGGAPAPANGADKKKKKAAPAESS